MEQDHKMHHSDHDQFALTYAQDLPHYTNSSSSSFIVSNGVSARFHNSDAFASPHRHEQHEAEHVYNSPPLTLDPSTLNLRSNSNDNLPPSSANPSGSNSSTPTGSLRLSTYNLPSNLNAGGVTTRRRARASFKIEEVHVHPDIGFHQQVEQQQSQSQHSNPQPEMQDIRMQPSGDLPMAVDDGNDSGLSSGSMDHNQAHGAATPHAREMYTLLPGNNSQGGYYLNSNPDGFSNSPISPSSPPGASRDHNLHSSGLDSASPVTTNIARSFRPTSLSLGISGNRSIPLIHPPSNHASPVQQLSPSHGQHPQLSSHPHMHPMPYYPLQHQSGSPGFPSTPTTSHHTQGSSSSSHSSGHTRYSLRGSPAPRSFGHRHARSSSFGTVSTMSVRSTSPANSVASAFTSLSGGGSGSAGPTGSPTSYGGESGADVTIPFTETSPPSRAQSHPPLSMPTAHPALTAYSALLPPQRKSMLQQGTGEYLNATGEQLSGEQLSGEQRHPLVWPPPPEGFMSPPPGPLMTKEEYQAQLRPRPIITRAPHRKQKLANSDRKAICMYAKQHPNARQEDIAARYNVERSTISKILKNKERWLGCPDDEAKVARKRKPRFDDLELVLKVWVEETREQRLMLSDALIRSKAKEEARQLGISEEKFKASSGWLENFKHRVGIRKGRYVGRIGDQWLPASESDTEEPRPAQDDNRPLVYTVDPPQPGYERGGKGAWRMPADPERQLDLDHDQGRHGIAMEQQMLSGPAQAEDQGSAPPDSPSRSRMDERPGGVGMRKTRSRTLAEAREAALGGSTSPAGLGPASGSEPSSEFSQSSAVTSVPDIREASAGLGVALDFIGSQPEFATPDEVAVLQKISRKMSRAEFPRQHSTSSGSTVWNGTGES